VNEEEGGRGRRKCKVRVRSLDDGVRRHCGKVVQVSVEGVLEVVIDLLVLGEGRDVESTFHLESAEPRAAGSKRVVHRREQRTLGWKGVWRR
jgi:hypothetical protein